MIIQIAQFKFKFKLRTLLSCENSLCIFDNLHVEPEG